MSDLDRLVALAGLATDNVAQGATNETTIEESDCDCDCGESPCNTCGEDHHNVKEGRMADLADIDAAWPEISALKMKLHDQGMEPEEAQDEAAEQLGYDPEMVDHYLEYKFAEEVEETEEETTVEAVGDAAECFYDMQDAFAGGEAEGAHKSLIDELVRYLSGDQLEDFCDDFKRHHDMGMNEAEIDEADIDENAFNQAAAAASRAGKDTFEFGGKTHKTTMKKDTAHKLDDDVNTEVNEAPTMGTTQLINLQNLLKNSGLSEEFIEQKINEWANTPSPELVGEQEPTAHGDAYDFAQGVNLSLKRYLDAEDMKVGLKEHKVEDLKAAYKASKDEG